MFIADVESFSLENFFDNSRAVRRLQTQLGLGASFTFLKFLKKFETLVFTEHSKKNKLQVENAIFPCSRKNE